MTQIAEAQRGHVTDQIKQVAESEKLPIETIRKRVAAGNR